MVNRLGIRYPNNLFPNTSTAHYCLCQWFGIQAVWVCFYACVTDDDVIPNGDV